ncbi:hypothetical protein NL676_031065 [Syzygium grande]|nr:hypothetical protein NL676_031065 [Syzygium grande]
MIARCLVSLTFLPRERVVDPSCLPTIVAAARGGTWRPARSNPAVPNGGDGPSMVDVAVAMEKSLSSKRLERSWWVFKGDL